MDSNRYITIGPIYGLKNIYYNMSLINKSKPEFVSKNLVLNNLRNDIYHKIITVDCSSAEWYDINKDKSMIISNCYDFINLSKNVSLYTQ